MAENLKPVSAEKSAALALAFATLPNVGNMAAVLGIRPKAGDRAANERASLRFAPFRIVEGNK
jgi:hypothetical protein